MYNLNVHMQNGNSVHHMWHEGMASRGTREIFSCIYNFCRSLPPHITEFNGWCDNCSGQNKNTFSPKYGIAIVNDNTLSLNTMNIKFLEVGHTYMEADQDFGLIEREKKGKKIFVPAEWKMLIKGASKRFRVTMMDDSQFINCDSLDGVLRTPKKDEDGNPIRWLQIRWMRFTRGSYSMLFKTTHNADAPFRRV